MKYLALVLPLLLTATARAQEAGDLPAPIADSPAALAAPAPGSPSDVVPANLPADVWIYLQEMRRYEDPQQAVRRKAERKAQERRDRMAAMKWYGYSASRPQASPTPFMGSYSPRWVGNSGNPFGWVPSFYHPRVVRTETRTETEVQR